MCGIIGYTGNENCVPMLLSGLGTLEYRGYDSAGIAVDTGHGVAIVKKKGRLDVLREAVAELGDGFGGSCGIGHTRWATHGAPSDVNSHPHSAPSLTLVHNGIIENYAALRARLSEMGYTFQSETDTEVAAMWLDYCYRETGDPIRAMFRAAGDFTGSFALGVMFFDRPHVLYAMRRDSPLVVTSWGDASLIASDIPATLSFSRTYRRPEENTVVELCGGEIRFYREDGSQTEVKEEHVDWDVEAAQKSGFPHFMLKEICEEPEALLRTVQPILRDGGLHFDVPFLDGDGIRDCKFLKVRREEKCVAAERYDRIGNAVCRRFPVGGIFHKLPAFRIRFSVGKQNAVLFKISVSVIGCIVSGTP